MLNFATDRVWDVAVVGAGPAGLAAAVYLARFLRSIVVFDAGDARANLISKTHNCPGFPEGVSGEDLLSRLRDQARIYGTNIVHGGVEGIEGAEGSFSLSTTAGDIKASRVILATGIVYRVPEIAGLQRAIAAGTVRLCPVCDAYEAAGKRIAVAGPEHLALKEALFLKDYSSRICIISNYPDDVSQTTRVKAAAAGIEIWDVVDDLVPHSSGFEVIMADGSPARQIDVLYPSMGCDVRSELAASLGADCDEEGYVVVGNHLQTSVPGLYAIGDVAKALNQIAVGFGHAALAASHIHNDLRDSITTKTVRAALRAPRKRATSENH
jgi:thioredoxin reductase (NADPH)